MPEPIQPEVEGFLEECYLTIDKTFDVLEAKRPFLQPSTKVSLAVDIMFALTLHRLGVTEQEFATHVRNSPPRTE